MGNSVGLLESFAATVQLVLRDDTQLPDGFAMHSLLSIDRTSRQVAGFQELLVCPNRHGAQIIDAKTQKILYKVKLVESLNPEMPKWQIFEVTDRGKGTNTAVASITKARNLWTSRRGAYKHLQAWHVAASKLALKERRTMLSREAKRLCATPVDVSSLNIHIKVTGREAGERGAMAENWQTEFRISDSTYQMQLVGQNHDRYCDMRNVHITVDDKLVCTGRLQPFEHLGRNRFERPFLGIQLKADSLAMHGRQLTEQTSGEGDPASPESASRLTRVNSPSRDGSPQRRTRARASTPDLESSRRLSQYGLDQYSTAGRASRIGKTVMEGVSNRLADFAEYDDEAEEQQMPSVKPEELLPLFLMLCWAEEVVQAPDDLRRHFLAGMRNGDIGAQKFSSDVGWDTLPTAAQLNKYAGKSQKLRKKGDPASIVSRAAEHKIDLHDERQTDDWGPLPPTRAVSTKKTTLMPSSRHPMRPISLMSV
eukprot:TRINITY_DN60422_c0_g1_i1.p1 TRINITY_DN60422_c0_g1~~TRINITY_DN60422_c0_g1_i1.p1  ORF type:complete len:481 (+),score=111.40 TRINITY_DN60422_c0_g1_i1:89-1531(+)